MRSFQGTSGVLGLPLSLELDEATLRSSGGFRQRVISLSDARVRLGVWLLPGVWTPIGAVLCVEGREGRLRIGVRDRAVRAEERTMPPEGTVDVLLEAADFDTLRSTLLSPPPVATHPSIHAFEIVRNRVSGLGALEMFKPWFLTILFLCIVGPLGGLTIGDSPLGRAVLTLIALGAIANGLARTVLGSRRPPPPHRLEVGTGTVVLRDPKSEILFEVPRGSVSVHRGVYRMSGRGQSLEVPVLELRGAERVLLRVGVWDSRFVTGEHVVPMSTPRFLVGAPEWEALLLVLSPDHRA